MLIVTTNDVPGYRVVKTLGLVRGITVRSRNVISDAIGGLQSMLGGRVGAYVKLAEASRAEAYDERFQPWTGAGSTDPGGFNVKEFRSNAVFRWEYMPGSTLFLVWSQGRSEFAPRMGDADFRDELGDLFGQRAEDRFLVKVSYWWNR